MSVDGTLSAEPYNPQDAQPTVGEQSPPSAAESGVPRLPASIGRYRILRLLGEGGMGAVYEAEQEQPRRKVALKVIKAAWASPQLIRRFEQESQALARLHHPGIAQIYEAGTADTGIGAQPFFAMELIHGKPLVEFAEAQRMNTPQRLELMIRVCDAVQHAHQRGIIHRDLKPANILVEENGQPKILDFGLARITDSDAQATRQTDMGELLGTLAYMSPEQVLGDSLEVDTRSDVYTLGVILYELLAGRMPYALSQRLHEACQTIRETEPAPLSSANRLYRGDVDTIVAKSLEKDKGRRYVSAADLAADLQRYLKDEPITARPASTAYQLQKFARRHKALVGGVAAVIVVLLAGVVTSTHEALRASAASRAALRSRDQALASEQTAGKERDRALVARKIATREANRALAAEAQARREQLQAVTQRQRADNEAAAAKAVNDFLRHDLLAQASAAQQAGPSTKPDPDLKVRTALDRAATRIAGRFDQQPLVEASIRETMADTYHELGLYAEAQRQEERVVELRRQALGGEHPDTLHSRSDLAGIYLHQGKNEEAEKLFRQVLEVRRHRLGENHPDTLASLNGIATVYSAEGKYLEAEELFRKVVEADRRVLGGNDRQTQKSMFDLAVACYRRGKYAETEQILNDLLEIRRRTLGDEHPDTLHVQNLLAATYNRNHELARAEETYLKLHATEGRVLGNEHPDTLATETNLAHLYFYEHRYAEAVALERKVLDARRRVLGDQHPDVLRSMSDLATAEGLLGDYAQARSLLENVLDQKRKALGEQHPDVGLATNNLAWVYEREGKYEQAQSLFQKGLEIERKTVGENHYYALTGMNDFAELYLKKGNFAEAETLYSKAIEGRQRVLGAEAPDTLVSMRGLADVYYREGKNSGAETLLDQVVSIQRRVLPAKHSDLLDSLTLLGEVEMAEGQYAKAESPLGEALEGYKSAGMDSWERYKCESLLGASLAGQKNYARAESLLIEGYQGMAARKDRIAIPDLYHLDGAFESVVQLYRDWDKPQKAAEWQERTLAQKPVPAKGE